MIQTDTFQSCKCPVWTLAQETCMGLKVAKRYHNFILPDNSQILFYCNFLNIVLYKNINI